MRLQEKADSHCQRIGTNIQAAFEGETGGDQGYDCQQALQTEVLQSVGTRSPPRAIGLFKVGRDESSTAHHFGPFFVGRRRLVSPYVLPSFKKALALIAANGRLHL